MHILLLFQHKKISNNFQQCSLYIDLLTSCTVPSTQDIEEHRLGIYVRWVLTEGRDARKRNFCKKTEFLHYADKYIPNLIILDKL